MEKTLREQIALFRFGLISTLMVQKDMGRGEQEQRIREITSRSWDIPGSPRSSIGRSTVLRWIELYRRGGCDVRALEPRPRCDRGRSRALSAETEAALIELRRQMPEVSLPVFLKVARSRSLLDPSRMPSKDSLYRMFHRNGLDKEQQRPIDRRRFEAELVNDLWQSDCMHGPRVTEEGKLRKSYLFALIDDHSRLIPHAQFYLAENLPSYLDCLMQALEKRGLPRKLYVDNGSAFRSHHLKYACARLGVALLHSPPYTPEGRGKIERFFRTLRMQLLPLIEEQPTLESLNRHLRGWIDEEYHKRVHSSTGQSPLERYLAQVGLLRGAPKDLREYFRHSSRRKVDKDRTVTLNGRLYEAPLGLIGRTVTLLYHPEESERVEVFFEEQSAGFLLPLNTGVNSRVRRTSREQSELLPLEEPSGGRPYHGGSLFETEKSS